MSSINLEMNDLEGERETKLPHFSSRMYVLLPSKYLFLEPEKRKRVRWHTLGQKSKKKSQTSICCLFEQSVHHWERFKES